MKKAKSESWKQFVSTLQPQYSYATAWKKIQTIDGRQKYNFIRNLNENNM